MTNYPEIDATAPRKPIQAFSLSGTYHAFRSLIAHSAPIAALLASVLVMGCASGPAVDINRDVAAPADPAERFAVLAFENERGDEMPLVRWEKGEVTIFHQGPHFAYLDRAAQQAGAATGVRIRYVATDARSADIVSVVTSWREIERLLAGFPNAERYVQGRHRFTCAAPWLASTGQMVKAFVLVDIDLSADHIRRCMVQEIAHAMGLSNDIDDPGGTVFSSNSTRDTLSESDKLMLRILYDPRLETGMSRAEAMPIVRAILQDGTT